MTTIAYKDGAIAYDGRICAGDVICTDQRDKCLHPGSGAVVFVSGGDDAADEVAQTWPDIKTTSDDWNAFVWDGKTLWFCGSSDGAPWKCRQRLDEVMAIGSGACYAHTAMDLGRSAWGAVEAASMRDTHTGGKIREYRLW